ncbi:unnamed protein product, partial [Polarella glacialis]
QPLRRHAPLPPLGAPRGSQVAGLIRPEASQGAYPFASSSSSTSSRPSSTNSLRPADLQDVMGRFLEASAYSSRSTSASSCGGDGNLGATAGDLLASMAQDSPQAELVVKAMLPIVKRAM